MEEEAISDIKRNPFAVHSPDALEKVPADYLVNLFVEEYTSLTTIEKQKHTFIWGSRGSGKSFIFRYMEPKCQRERFGSLEDFLENNQSFIGVYFPCKKGYLDKKEFDNIDNKDMRNAIEEHLLNISIAERTVHTVKEQIPSKYYNKEKARELIEDVLFTLDDETIGRSKTMANREVDDKEESPLEWLQILLEDQSKQIISYLNNLNISRGTTEYQGSATGYHDFIQPFMKSIEAIVGNDRIPIYLLIDDGFYLREYQQKVINTWIGNRDQAYLCIKVSADRPRYSTISTKSGDPIDRIDDYTQVYLDEQYTTEHNAYMNKVEEVANKRLEISECPANNIKELLPEREFEQELLKEIKEEMEEEWEEKGRPTENLSNYIDKYARARLHQRLSENKNSKYYSGFDYIVHLSSGRIRYFLQPCHDMFEEYKKQGKHHTEMGNIPPKLQDRVINDHAKELLQEKPKDIRKDLKTEEWSKLDKLMTLVNSLGNLFHHRLHDEDHREPRVFSFQVRDMIPHDSEVKQVLDLGLRKGYFSLDEYPSKEGGGGKDLYILNRRVAPYFTIDPTSFRGRVQLDHQKLKIGCEDPEEFVRIVHGTDEHQENLDNFSEEGHSEDPD